MRIRHENLKAYLEEENNRVAATRIAKGSVEALVGMMDLTT